MKVLVTGGAGYIGSHTCKELALQGHTPIVYDNLSTGHREFVRYGDFEHGDILDTQRLRAVMRQHRPEGVIHFASSIAVGESVANPGKYYRNNVVGSLSIMEAMRDEGIPHIVMSSSAAVYGHPAEIPIPVSCPKAPINPYGETKAFMERMLAAFATAHGLNWAALRYFNAAGCDADGEVGEWHEPETHLIPRVIWAAQGKIDALHIFGDDYPTPDGTCIRDYVHVRDLAQAHILALQHLALGHESRAFNLGTGTGFSVREIIEGVEKVSGKNVPCTMAPRRPGDPARLIADASESAEVLGWHCEYSQLENILESALRWSEKLG